MMTQFDELRQLIIHFDELSNIIRKEEKDVQKIIELEQIIHAFEQLKKIAIKKLLMMTLMKH